LTLLTLNVQIGLERSRLLELEEKANSLHGKIGSQRKAMGGVNAAREANIQVQHRMCMSHVHESCAWCRERLTHGAVSD